MKLVLFVVALGLTGCAWQAQIATDGAKAADDALAAAEWALCNAATVGSVKRRYQDPIKRDAYNALCPTPMLP